MRPLLLLPYYITWHYTSALKRGIAISKNFIWFAWHFFSIGLLFKTLFQPWERMKEEKEPGLEFSKFISAWTLNGVFRMVGAIIRLTVIGVGFVFILGIIVASLALFVAWIFLPIVLLVIFIAGIALLFK